MKVIAINGVTHSGKTTLCQTIIGGLRKRGYTVGSVKEIHFEQFRIDPMPNSNTLKHRKAGAQRVTARGVHETDILYQEMLPIDEILQHYDHDFVILEGVSDCNVPRILTALSEKEVEEAMDDRAVLVSGVLANTAGETVCGLPVINALEEPDRLVNFVIDYAFEPMPHFDPKCCTACGHSCRELTGLICQGKAKREDCVLSKQKVELLLNGKPVPMVPFVQNVMKNTVMAVAKELDGVSGGGEIEVRFRV